jgi:hypothetical protein
MNTFCQVDPPSVERKISSQPFTATMAAESRGSTSYMATPRPSGVVVGVHVRPPSVLRCPTAPKEYITDGFLLAIFTTPCNGLSPASRTIAHVAPPSLLRTVLPALLPKRMASSSG